MKRSPGLPNWGATYLYPVDLTEPWPNQWWRWVAVAGAVATEQGFRVPTGMRQ